MSSKPFNPCGATIAVAGATSAPSGVQATNTVNATAHRIVNSGSVLVHVAFGEDASTAQTNAVIPTGGGSNAKNSYAIPAGAMEVITAPANSYWSAITASSTATVYVTPGRGV
jgi:hypothetical protein